MEFKPAARTAALCVALGLGMAGAVTGWRASGRAEALSGDLAGMGKALEKQGQQIETLVRGIAEMRIQSPKGAASGMAVLPSGRIAPASGADETKEQSVLDSRASVGSEPSPPAAFVLPESYRAAIQELIREELQRRASEQERERQQQLRVRYEGYLAGFQVDVDGSVQRYARRLGLNEYQKERLRKILEDYHRKRIEFFKGLIPPELEEDPTEWVAKVYGKHSEDIRRFQREQQREIKSILTPQQFEKFESPDGSTGFTVDGKSYEVDYDTLMKLAKLLEERELERERK